MRLSVSSGVGAELGAGFTVPADAERAVWVSLSWMKRVSVMTKQLSPRLGQSATLPALREAYP